MSHPPLPSLPHLARLRMKAVKPYLLTPQPTSTDMTDLPCDCNVPLSNNPGESSKNAIEELDSVQLKFAHSIKGCVRQYTVASLSNSEESVKEPVPGSSKKDSLSTEEKRNRARDYLRSYRSKIKQDPVKYQRYREMQKRSQQKYIDSEEKRKQARESVRKYREKIKSDPEKLERYRQLKKKSQEKYMEQVRLNPEKYQELLKKKRQCRKTKDSFDLSSESGETREDLIPIVDQAAQESSSTETGGTKEDII